jgi:hypothetical protein
VEDVDDCDDVGEAIGEGPAGAGIDVDMEVVIVFAADVDAGTDTVIEVLRPCKTSVSV